jgi:D-alanyl-lipoteichoic acid acyltransferase DltB (MBOAT superfamily)
MLFPTVTFTLFFFVFLSLWQLCGRTAAARERLLAAGTMIFYGFLSPAMLGYLAAWSLLLWWGGRTTGSEKRSKRLAFVTLFAGILQLVFWKTFELFTRSDLPAPLDKWVIPVGVSFFTFQGLTYLFQRMKGELTDPWSGLRIFAFCGFFPTLLSGPIVRARAWLSNLEHPVAPQMNQAMAALVLGLTYKLVFSTLLGGFTNSLYSEPAQQTALGAYLGLYAYSLQLYCDFCGYSLMAGAVASFLGFRLPDNFDRPYAAPSVAEFWRRWHISFSSWLKDYVYIAALGGNRKGPVRRVVNVMATFMLCGAWHGFALHYLIWGAWQAVSVAYSSVVRFRVPSWVARVVAGHVVALGWVWFRAASASDALDYFQSLFTGSWAWDPEYILVIAWVAGAGLLHIYEKPFLAALSAGGARLRHAIPQAVYWTVLIVLTLLASPPGLPPFIYASY